MEKTEKDILDLQRKLNMEIQSLRDSNRRLHEQVQNLFAMLETCQVVSNHLTARAIQEETFALRILALVNGAQPERKEAIKDAAKTVVQAAWKPSDGLAANPGYR